MVEQYAIDRDEAFMAFVEDGDFAHIDRLMDRYGLERIPHTVSVRAGILKAVQECTRIPDHVKADALAQCTSLGFHPFMGRVR